MPWGFTVLLSAPSPMESGSRRARWARPRWSTGSPAPHPACRTGLERKLPNPVFYRPAERDGNVIPFCRPVTVRRKVIG